MNVSSSIDIVAASVLTLQVVISLLVVLGTVEPAGLYIARYSANITVKTIEPLISIPGLKRIACKITAQLAILLL
jgi:hypothetical protein